MELFYSKERYEMVLRPSLAATEIMSMPVDPAAVFEAGMVAGLVNIGGETFATVSDGITIPPIGIIDDNKTMAFSGAVTDEVVFVEVPTQVTELNESQILVSSMDLTAYVDQTNIQESTFTSNLDILLNPTRGIITIPKGTPLNIEEEDPDTGEIVYGFEVICSYRFNHTDFPGEDTTDGSGMISIHFKRGTFTTNMFDTLAVYEAGSPLYVNSEGLLTSQDTGSPEVGTCLSPSNAVTNELYFMWL